MCSNGRVAIMNVWGCLGSSLLFVVVGGLPGNSASNNRSSIGELQQRGKGAEVQRSAAVADRFCGQN